MRFEDLRARRAAVKSLVAQIELLPTVRLLQLLCDEARAGMQCDAKCAIGFAAVFDVARDLLVEGAGTTITQLAGEVSSLDCLVAVRLLQEPAPRTFTVP